MRPDVFVVAAVMVIAGISCDRLPSGAVGSEMADVPSCGWMPDAPVEFEVAVYDTVSSSQPPYELILHVRYLRSCSETILPLALQEVSLEGGYRDPDTLEIRLFGQDGKPLGRGGYNIYETRDTLKSGFSIPEGYMLSVAPVREVSGVVSVGYTLCDKNSAPLPIVY